MNRGYKQQTSTNEDYLNDLLTKIVELADMRTIPGGDSTIYGKIFCNHRDFNIQKRGPKPADRTPSAVSSKVTSFRGE